MRISELHQPEQTVQCRNFFKVITYDNEEDNVEGVDVQDDCKVTRRLTSELKERSSRGESRKGASSTTQVLQNTAMKFFRGVSENTVHLT